MMKARDAMPSVSANGNAHAIVRAISTRTCKGTDKPAVLYAFDPRNITQLIYNSEHNSTRDRGLIAKRFVFPLVANGRVYFGARGEVDVYGLLK